jgi:hypothetical protein
MEAHLRDPKCVHAFPFKDPFDYLVATAEVWIYEDLVQALSMMKWQQATGQKQGEDEIDSINFDSPETVKRYTEACQELEKYELEQQN